jgi:arabinogalactan oligomer/maltooligosaccharide transport system substrate-binding protein
VETEIMSNSQFVGPSFLESVRAPNYVNGRLLSAEDLKADQDAMLTRFGWLGEAVGPGIVEGLEVSKIGSTQISVTPGLGFNQQGYAMRLANAISLSLVAAPSAPSALDDAGRFVACRQLDGGGVTAEGIYLLTVVPASRLEGLAPVQGTSGATPACASRWEVDGLQFKAIRLDGFRLDAWPDATGAQRRNLLAHWIFGSLRLQDLARDPFLFDANYGALDQLSADDLTPCDLPLAVYAWQGGVLDFVDMWAVRRRLIRPGALTGWRGSLSDKRVAEGEARFLQFQAHLAALVPLGSSSVMSAKTAFRFLPPVGYLPIKPLRPLTQQIAQRFLSRLIARLQALAGNQVNDSLFLTFLKVTPSASASATLAHTLLLILNKLKSSLIDHLDDQMPAAGLDLPAFFGSDLPDHINLIERESVDFRLHQSWHDEAIDLRKSPRFELYVVEELWVRPMAARLVALFQAAQNKGELPKQPLLLTMLREIVQQDLDALGEGASISGPAPAGSSVLQDRLYVMFAKSVRRPVRVPIAAPPTKPPTDDVVGTVTLWHAYVRGSPAEQMLTEQIIEARKQYPKAKIEVLRLDPSTLITKWQTAAAAGAPPDIVLHTSDTIGELVRNQLVHPVETALQESQVAPLAYDALTVGGTLYGIPKAFLTVALIYKTHSISNLPSSLIGWMQREFTSKLAIPAHPYHDQGLFTAFGGQIMDAAGRCIADRGAYVEALRFMLELRNTGAVVATSVQEAIDAFKNETRAVLLNGPWALAELRASLAEPLAVASLPDAPVAAAQPFVSVEAFLLDSKSKNVDSAIALARFLTRAPAQQAFAASADAVPVRTDVTVDALLQGFQDAALRGQIMPQNSQFKEYWGPFTAMMAQVFNNNQPPDTAVKAATQAMNQANGF